MRDFLPNSKEVKIDHDIIRKSIGIDISDNEITDILNGLRALILIRKVIP